MMWIYNAFIIHILQTEPDSVGSIMVTSAAATEVNITWVPPNSRCPVEGYYIEYELTNLDMCQTVDNPTRISYGFVDGTSATIKGLVPFSMYSVFIVATNQAGNGTEAEASVETGEAGKY